MISTKPFHGLHPLESDPENSIDLTSLLDVMFILLIFFILTAGITHIYTEINLPQTTEGTSPVSTLDEPLMIEIHASDKWILAGKPVAKFEDLKTAIIEFRKTKPEGEYVIAPENNIEINRLLSLLNFMASLEIDKVQVISVTEPTRP
ncbi:MAG: biopolymer transporter ExbD [SAR324 cluster bacterium]|nr:biopolymer transporter ExbD [SAR324 cluster bacterium]